MQEDLDKLQARYCVYQEELGANGTMHLQGYLEFNKVVRMSWIKDKLNEDTIHLEKAMGTPQQCRDYCTKEDTRIGGPYEFGEIGKGSGSRNDIIKLRDAIMSGKRGRDLFLDDETCVAATKYAKGTQNMVEAFTDLPERDQVKVTFHYGPPGTGKTYCAHNKGAYLYDGNNGFWNLYNGQESVIFDEFGGHVMSPLQFQRVCDAYPMSVNTKGGCQAFAGIDIHICSNYLPERWWSEKTKFLEEAVYRRIHEVHYHDKFKHYFKYVSDTPGQYENCAMLKLKLKLLQDTVNIQHIQ